MTDPDELGLTSRLQASRHTQALRLNAARELLKESMQVLLEGVPIACIAMQVERVLPHPAVERIGLSRFEHSVGGDPMRGLALGHLQEEYATYGAYSTRPRPCGVPQRFA